MPCYDFGTHNVKRPNKGRRNAGDSLVIIAEIEANSISGSEPRTFVRTARQGTIHERIRELLVLGWIGGSKLVPVLGEMGVTFPSVGKWHDEPIFTIPLILFQVSRSS